MAKRVPNGTHYIESYHMSQSLAYIRIEGDKVLKHDGYAFSETGISVDDVCEHNDFIRVSDKYDQNY
jgi:hypothetical protein